jgi:hypothetical protein
MKTLLLGLAITSFAASSAFAEGCSYGMAKMSHGTKSETVAQSQPVKMPQNTSEKLDFAELKDAWVINLLNKA